MNEQPATPQLTDALALVQALTANIKFNTHNSRNGQCVVTVPAYKMDTSYEQAPFTAGANRYFKHPTPTRVMDSIIEQQMRTGTHSIQLDRHTQRFVRPAVERALKHLSPTATASEFMNSVREYLCEQPDVAEVRTALRNIIREQ